MKRVISAARLIASRRQLSLFPGDDAQSDLPSLLDIPADADVRAYLRDKGMTVIGADEAGRGPLAGPVVAAAAVLTDEQEQRLLAMGLRDSKKMTAASRERVFAAMNELGVLWRAQAAGPDRIERDNILRASLWAMGRSVEKLRASAGDEPLCVVADGTFTIETDLPQCALVKADAKIAAVSAASVAAKVLRDRIMTRLDALFPGYGFASNKGYPTKTHREAVGRLGLSPVHRRLFCRKLTEGV